MTYFNIVNNITNREQCQRFFENLLKFPNKTKYMKYSLEFC